MWCQQITLRSLLLKLSLVGLVWNCLSLSGAVFAQSGAKPAGELVFAKQVTINNINGSAGQTIFSESRIKTGGQGSAVINLGKYGRVELGADTELVLKFSENSVGGELIRGCMSVNASANVAASVNTAIGNVFSDGAQPALLRIGHNSDVMHVMDSLGEATVASGSKAEIIRAGQYISVGSKSGGGIFSRILPLSECGLEKVEQGITCACNATAVAGKSAVPKTGSGAAGKATVSSILSMVGLAGLIGLAGAATILTSSDGSGITCVNNPGGVCIPISNTGIVNR